MFRRLQIRKDLFISYFIFPIQIVIFIPLSFFSVLRYLTFLRISNHSFLHVHPHIIEYFFPLQNLFTSNLCGYFLLIENWLLTSGVYLWPTWYNLIWFTTDLFLKVVYLLVVNLKWFTYDLIWCALPVTYIQSMSYKVYLWPRFWTYLSLCSVLVQPGERSEVLGRYGGGVFFTDVGVGVCWVTYHHHLGMAQYN